MAEFVCLNPDCGGAFKSKHSTAKYCSRSCAALVNIKKNTSFLAGAKVSYGDEELLEHIRDWVKKTEKVPSSKEFDKVKSTPSTTTYRDRFGTWNNAVILAGFTPNMVFPECYYVNERNLVTPAFRFRILKRDGFACQYCGGKPADGYELHVDHIVAIANGGTSTEQNLITACSLCNIGKSDKPG